LNPGFAAAAAACLVAAIAFHWLQSPARVSAHELLEKAAVSDLNTTRPGGGKVVRQRVQVRRKSLRTGQETTAFRDCWFGLTQPVSEPAAAGALMDELRGVYRANGLDWNAPLAVAGVARWRSSLHSTAESVTLKGNFVLTVEDRAARRGGDDDQLRLIRMFLRPVDMHPVQQELETGQARYGISEVSLAIVDPPMTIRASLPPPVHPARPNLPEPMSTPASETGPSLADRLQAEFVIHESGACQGAMVEVDERPGEGLAVHGIVDTEERKQALIVALRAIAAVSTVEIETIADATSKAAHTPAPPAAEPSMVLRSTSFALEKPLYSHFRKSGTPEQAREQTSLLIDGLLGRSASAAQEAAALKRLAKTYPAGKLAALPIPSRQLLSKMVREHSRLLALDLEDVRGSLAAVESVLGIEHTDGETLAGDLPAAATDNWERDGEELQEVVHELETRIWALLTSSPASIEQTRQAAETAGRSLARSGQRMKRMLASVEELGDRNKTAELNRKTH